MTEQEFLQEFETIKDNSIFDDIKGHGLPVIIFGAAKWAEMITELLRKNDVPITSYAVDAEYYTPNKTYLGLPIYNFAELDRDKYVFILGIGDKNRERMNQFMNDKNLIKYRVLESAVRNITCDYIAEHKDKWVETYNLLSDDFSKKTMLVWLKTLITQNMEHVHEIFSRGEYFNELTRNAIYRGGGDTLTVELTTAIH